MNTQRNKYTYQKDVREKYKLEGSKQKKKKKERKETVAHACMSSTY